MSSQAENTARNQDATVTKSSATITTSGRGSSDDGSLSPASTVAEPAISVADLLRELQETNRLLRTLATQQAVASPSTEQTPVQSAAASPSLPQGLPISREPPLRPRPEVNVVRGTPRQIIKDLAHAVFGPNPTTKERLESYYRGEILRALTKAPESGPGPGRPGSWQQARLMARLGNRLTELIWNWAVDINIVERGFPLTDNEREQLSRQWPVQLDLDRMTQTVVQGNGWIVSKNRDRDGWFCGFPLLQGPDGEVMPARAVLDVLQKDSPDAARLLNSDVLCPGSSWHFATPVGARGILPLSVLSLVAAAYLMNPEDDSTTLNAFLYSFCAAWVPLSTRGLDREFSGWSGGEERTYQHAIRCFALGHNAAKADLEPYFLCHREAGQFPSLPGDQTSTFTERRMSVMCRWVYSGYADRRGFTIITLSDFQTAKDEAGRSNDAFADWEDRRFTVRGGNAGYHMLQSVVHRMLLFWEKEWSLCLDKLESTVNTKLGEILSNESSSSLMFDTSFSRSKVYFKTLEMLRIFGDTIRETGRDLQQMNPERYLQGSFHRAGWRARYFLRDDPLTDNALWDNWHVLSEHQKAAEERLLRRIAEKTEEIKSLRDGLFNATSLREASRSTTMNRYVIVFTIFTVLYLPPSLTSSLFGTELFNADDQAGTINRFRDSTIIFCVVTYVISFALIWVAGKWDAAGSLYHKTHAMWQGSWVRFRRRYLDNIKAGFGGRDKVEKGLGDKEGKMSV